MADETAITPEDLAAARALFAGALMDCPYCGGFSRPDPRRAPTRCEPMLLLIDDGTLWAIRCFSCSARVVSEFSAADAVETWNRRTGSAARQAELLPLVDLQSLARASRVVLTLDQEAFSIAVQRAVLSLNRRPMQ